MKRIENITIHRNCNYGSVLQTYATQLTFNEFNFECETIDFIRESDTKNGALDRLKNKSEKLGRHSTLLLAAKAVMFISYLRKEKVFNQFLDRYIKLSEREYYSNEEIKEYLPRADAYCTGSDQIWNSYWNEGIEPAYYLEFVPENAICFSYASSIGQDIPDSETKPVSQMLKKYRFISVRESISVDTLNRLGCSNVVQVLDPTLFRTRGDWEQLSSNKYKGKKYIVTYNLHHDKKLDEFASRLAKEKHLELLNISYNWHDVVRPGKLVWCPKVEEYIGLIRDAEYVIADSFHATAFSIQFQKKFMVFYPEKASIRIRDILKQLDIENRGTDGKATLQDIDKIIDYDAVNTRLTEFRKRDKEFLTDVFRTINNTK